MKPASEGSDESVLDRLLTAAMADTVDGSADCELGGDELLESGRSAGDSSGEAGDEWVAPAADEPQAGTHFVTVAGRQVQVEMGVSESYHDRRTES